MALVSVSATLKYYKSLYILFKFTQEELRRFKETKKVIVLEGSCCGTNRCFVCLLGKEVTVSLAEYEELYVDAKTEEFLLQQQKKSLLNDIVEDVLENLKEERYDTEEGEGQEVSGKVNGFLIES